MPWVSFFNSHAKGIEILFHLFQKTVGVYDGSVLFLLIIFDAVSGHSMSKTQIGLSDLGLANILLLVWDEELSQMGSDSSEELNVHVAWETLDS